jgi:hypothetical protein
LMSPLLGRRANGPATHGFPDPECLWVLVLPIRPSSARG